MSTSLEMTRNWLQKKAKLKPYGESSTNLLVEWEIMQNMTEGKWSQSMEGKELSGISIYEHSLEKNQIYVITGKHDTKKINYLLEIAKKSEVAGIITDHEGEIDTILPILKVKNSNNFLKELAIKSRSMFRGLVIMVIGTHGKTSIKNQIGSILSEHYNCHYFHDSKNMDKPIFKNLASIKKNTEIVIIEAATAKPGTGETRSHIIKPHMLIIGDIAEDHMRYYTEKSQLIRNKFKCMAHLEGRNCIIMPYQAQYINSIEKEANAYDYNLLLYYGDNCDCYSRLKKSEITCKGHTVTAIIEHEKIIYDIPFMESYAAKQSLAALTVSSLLGIDLKSSSKKLISLKNYKSSGNLYKILLNNTLIYLYDQSCRGSVSGFISTLDLIENIKLPGIKRKIGVFAEIYDEELNGRYPIDLNGIADKINNSGLDYIYTMLAFNKLHKNMQIRISREHVKSIKKIISKLIMGSKNGDIIFIRASDNNEELAEIRRQILRKSQKWELMY